MICLKVWYYFCQHAQYKSAEDFISSFRSGYHDMEEVYDTDAFLYERIREFLSRKNEIRLFTSDGFGKESRYPPKNVYHFESYPVFNC